MTSRPCRTRPVRHQYLPCATVTRSRPAMRTAASELTVTWLGTPRTASCSPSTARSREALVVTALPVACPRSGAGAGRACDSACSCRILVFPFCFDHAALQLTWIPVGEIDAAGAEQRESPEPLAVAAEQDHPGRMRPL